MSKSYSSAPRMNSMNQLNGNNNSNRRPSNINRISSIDKPPQQSSLSTVSPSTTPASSMTSSSTSSSGTAATFQQHEDLIKYIHDSWHKVSQEVDRNAGHTVIYYHEEQHQSLKEFQPFDLEGYWGQRVVQQHGQHS